MALAFDANYYLSTRPDVFNAFVKTAGATGQTWAQFAEAHYNTFGRFEGSNPNATFNTNQYLAANPDVAAAGVNPFTHFLNFGAKEGRAPSATFPSFASFDEKAYLAANPDLGAAGITTKGAAYEHFVKFGQFEARPGAPAVDTGVPGQTFTLTTATGEIVNGTSANDTFNAVVAEDAGFPTLVTSSTLNAFDQVTGGEGVDTLNLVVQDFGGLTGDVSTLQGTVQGVEIINVDQANGLLANGTGGTLAAGAFAGAEQIWQINQANSISGLAEGQTAGFRNTAATTASVTFAAAATTAAIALDEVASDTRINVEGTGINTINISGSVVEPDATTDAVLTIGGAETGSGVTNSLAALRTVNIDLSSNTEIGVFTDALDAVTTINASASTGDLVLDFTDLDTGSQDLTSLSTGSGADEVSLEVDDFDSTAVSINLGAGNDVITIDGTEGATAATATAADLTALSVTLGAGRDIVEISGLANLVAVDASANTVTQSSIIITDFNGSEDVLDLSELGLDGFFATQNLVDTAASNAAANGGSLADVIAAIDDFASETEAVQFNFGGNTYVYVDNGFDGDTEVALNDGLIQINGDVALTGINVLFDDVSVM
ncbi:hypothetical protein HNR26_004604 [Rhizobium rosettiformans]|uniref:Calcium-binding protein n=2 Tax=Rhizobium rosettiformans TaxID=1368430 RepID=A0A4S8PLU2_9HYPH|nr:hypothetical protein [Rhizobium rosettiformans]MBB5278503.1 hypothetical protein [Rhizobium rosettiformans]THV31081.1 hypothetical protein FAA86_22495 [Rhizobium rosettiformans W3]